LKKKEGKRRQNGKAVKWEKRPVPLGGNITNSLNWAVYLRDQKRGSPNGTDRPLRQNARKRGSLLLGLSEPGTRNKQKKKRGESNEASSKLQWPGVRLRRGGKGVANSDGEGKRGFRKKTGKRAEEVDL